MIDENEMQCRVKLIKKARKLDIILNAFLFVAALCMLLPVVSIKIEIVDGLELTLDKISLVKVDWEIERRIFTDGSDYPLFETASNGWRYKDFLKCLPIAHGVIFIMFLFGLIRILTTVFSIYRSEVKVRKWAAKVNAGVKSGELKYRWYNTKIAAFIGTLSVLVMVGALSYFPLVLYPWVFKVAGCTLIWVCMLLPIIFLVLAGGVFLFRVVFAFTREEDLKLRIRY